MSGFNLEKESFNEAAIVADGVWTVCEPHKASGAGFLPDINNRGFIFKVKNKEGIEHLLMSGIPKKGCIEKVKSIEASSGLKLSLIVGQGDFHHMSIKDWLDAYPEVKIVQSGIKFPRTRNGSEILDNAEYAKRIELVEGPTFPSLKEYEDQVQFYGMNQFYVYSDQGWMSKDAANSTKLGTFGFLKNFAGAKPDQRFLAVWTYHVATKQLIYEHNFDIYMAKETLAQFPMMMRMMMGAENFGSMAKGPMPKGPTTMEGCKEHCEQMAKIVDLDVRAAVEYHSLPGTMVRKWESKEAYRNEMINVLSKTGEDDITGAKMFQVQNPACCTIS